MLKSYGVGWWPCDFSVSPSPFGLWDFGLRTADLVLTIGPSFIRVAFRKNLTCMTLKIRSTKTSLPLNPALELFTLIIGDDGNLHLHEFVSRRFPILFQAPPADCSFFSIVSVITGKGWKTDRVYFGIQSHGFL